MNKHGLLDRSDCWAVSTVLEGLLATNPYIPVFLFGSSALLATSRSVLLYIWRLRELLKVVYLCPGSSRKLVRSGFVARIPHSTHARSHHGLLTIYDNHHENLPRCSIFSGH
jgi:hypothetical protein